MTKKLENMKATTCRPTPNGGFEMVYHQTTVFKSERAERTVPDDSFVNKKRHTSVLRVTLDTGGSRTVTTKARMNWCFEQAGIPARVFQRACDWFIEGVGTDLPIEYNTQKLTLDFWQDTISMEWHAEVLQEQEGEETRKVLKHSNPPPTPK